MARSAPLKYTPIPPGTNWAPNRPIRVGDALPIFGIQDLADNIHFLALRGHRPISVYNHWNVGGNGYVVGKTSGSETTQGLWTFEPPRAPFSQWWVYIQYENTGLATPADDGTATVYLGSGGSTALTLLGATSQWGRAVGTLTLDPTQALDTVRLELTNGATGAVRVHSIALWPHEVTTMAAGAISYGSRRFVPHDTTELDADSPLSVHQIDTALKNLEYVHKTRPDIIVSFSDDPSRTTSGGFSEVGASYVAVVPPVPFRSGADQHAIRWALHGYRAGASGSVRMRTGYMISQDIDWEVVTLGSVWTDPYSAALHAYSDVGQDALSCQSDAWDILHVEIKGDGASKALLYSLCGWFKPVT